MASADETGHDGAPKYGTFETADGDTIVYDRDESTAWLQSDTVVRIRE